MGESIAVDEKATEISGPGFASKVLCHSHRALARWCRKDAERATA